MWSVKLRPRISFAIVKYHCSAPASAPKPRHAVGGAPPEGRALLHQRRECFQLELQRNRAIGCGDL